MTDARWYDLGSIADLAKHPLRQLTAGRVRIALSYKDGVFGAISGVCNHVGGPLGDGHLDGDYVVCPWHHWKFHCRTGAGEPGFEADRVQSYALRTEDGHLWVNLEPETQRHKLRHEPHSLARPVERAPGPVRVLGISTSVMDRAHPRYSTSEALLESALEAVPALGAERQLIRLNDLVFRPCEGHYSKSAHACTWPCSITQMDPDDQLTPVYEGIVHWADVILVSTPIRWGSASALYYKMVERMNCIQNQVTITDRVLLRNKVAAFIILGGQDNVQAVAGQMLGFFAEIGCLFPQFPYIAHTRGWDAEDMEKNITFVQRSESLHEGARALAERAVEMSKILLAADCDTGTVERAGRKAGAPPEMAPNPNGMEGTDAMIGE